MTVIVVALFVAALFLSRHAARRFGRTVAARLTAERREQVEITEWLARIRSTA